MNLFYLFPKHCFLSLTKEYVLISSTHNTSDWKWSVSACLKRQKRISHSFFYLCVCVHVHVWKSIGITFRTKAEFFLSESEASAHFQVPLSFRIFCWVPNHSSMCSWDGMFFYSQLLHLLSNLWFCVGFEECLLTLCYTHALPWEHPSLHVKEPSSPYPGKLGSPMHIQVFPSRDTQERTLLIRMAVDQG